ncbi:hypothetical protein [Glycomyces halotolerans]
MSIGFRPTDEDERIIRSFQREGENTTDVIRRGLRSLERLAWEDQARADMARLALENLAEEPDAWEYDESGDIRITGTDITVPSREGSGR